MKRINNQSVTVLMVTMVTVLVLTSNFICVYSYASRPSVWMNLKGPFQTRKHIQFLRPSAPLMRSDEQAFYIPEAILENEFEDELTNGFQEPHASAIMAGKSVHFREKSQRSCKGKSCKKFPLTTLMKLVEMGR